MLFFSIKNIARFGCNFLVSFGNRATLRIITIYVLRLQDLKPAIRHNQIYMSTSESPKSRFQYYVFIIAVWSQILKPHLLVIDENCIWMDKWGPGDHSVLSLEVTSCPPCPRRWRRRCPQKSAAKKVKKFNNKAQATFSSGGERFYDVTALNKLEPF